MNDALIAHARKLAGLGFVPLPLSGKAPILNEWQNIPHVDNQMIDGWIADGKLKNLGLRTGDRGLVVLDFDGKVGWEAFCKAFGELSDTYTVATGSGNGMHVYYHLGGELPKSTGQLEVPGGKIEIKAKGRQVVVPPSVHPETGALYEVFNKHPARALMSFEPIQAWINGFNASKYEPQQHELDTRQANGANSAYAKAALSNAVAELSAMNNVQDDYQNNTLNLIAWKLAHYVAHGDLSRTEVYNACESAMTANGYVQHFGRSSFEKTFESGFNRGMSDIQYTPKVYTNGHSQPRREMPGERSYQPPKIVQESEDVTVIGRTRILKRKNLFSDLIKRVYDDDYVPASPPIIFPLRCLHGLSGQARVTVAGKVIGVVGASGSGKTSALETIADAYVADGVPVWMWTPEWTPDEMAERVVQRYGGPTQDQLYLHEIDKWRSKTFNLPPNESQRLTTLQRQSAADAMRTVNAWADDVHFVENTLMTVSELAEVMGAAQGIVTPLPRVLIVDYAQLLKANEVDEKDDVSMYNMVQRFKSLCVYLGLIGIMATQTTKEESRLARQDGKPRNTTVINCTKNSRGRTGKVRVASDPEHLRILDTNYPIQTFDSDTHYLGSQSGRFINDDAFNLYLTLNPEMEAV